MSVTARATCKKCCRRRTQRTVEGAFRAGWGDNGTLCPSCRAERNARAAATTNRIVGGLAEIFVGQHEGSRTVTVQTLPELVTRSTWVTWGVGGLVDDDARAMWSELGDGSYLVTFASATETMLVAVQVSDGEVDVEPIVDAELDLIRALAADLGGGERHGPS